MLGFALPDLKCGIRCGNTVSEYVAGIRCRNTLPEYDTFGIAGLDSFESSTLATTSALMLASSEKLAIAVLLARHGEGGRARSFEMLTESGILEYKQTSSGALLEMLSQYRERSGGRAA